MNPYHMTQVYRLEQGLSSAEQRAADQRKGELAAALAEVRSAVADSVCRRLNALKAIGRAKHAREEASVAAAALAGR